MLDFLAENNCMGLLVGLLTFLIIGLFHPLVIKGEYYFGVKCWWAFLLAGIICVVFSVMAKIRYSPRSWVWSPSPASGASRRFSTSGKGWRRDGSRKERKKTRAFNQTPFFVTDRQGLLNYS